MDSASMRCARKLDRTGLEVENLDTVSYSGNLPLRHHCFVTLANDFFRNFSKE